jgi:hypothetical protein
MMVFFWWSLRLEESQQAGVDLVLVCLGQAMICAGVTFRVAFWTNFAEAGCAAPMGRVWSSPP